MLSFPGSVRIYLAVDLPPEDRPSRSSYPGLLHRPCHVAQPGDVDVLKGLGSCARKLIDQLGEVRSMDVIVPIRKEQSVAKLRIRTVEKPDEATRNLLAHLGLRLPNRNRMTEM